MKTKHFILITALILTILASCKDDYPTYFISQETKDLAFYKEGSWWLYKNQATGERDCVYVDKTKQHFYTEMTDKKITAKYEWFSATKKHTNNINEELFIDYFTESVLFCLKNLTSDDKYCNTILKPKPSFQYSFNYIVIGRLNDTLINNKIYTDIFKIICKQDTFKYTLWISKNNWIIRKREVWVKKDSIYDCILINSKILQ